METCSSILVFRQVCGTRFANASEHKRIGIPKVSKNNTTFWASPEEFYRFREGTGPGMIIWDELPQGVTQMQNAIAGCIYDRVLGPLEIDSKVIQIATGNSPKDKAGANRIVSQLGNRVLFYTIYPHIEDWCDWALANDINPTLIAFLREHPDILHDFQPDRLSNPTCRSWEAVSRSISEDMDDDVIFSTASGLVGEGAAVKYAGYKKLVGKIPTFDQVMLDPNKTFVPTEPSACFATAITLAIRCTDESYTTLTKYMSRLPVEYTTVFMKDAIRKNNKLVSTPAFIRWAQENKQVFSG